MTSGFTSALYTLLCLLLRLSPNAIFTAASQCAFGLLTHREWWNGVIICNVSVEDSNGLSVLISYSCKKVREASRYTSTGS
ncbi:hypothetical protein F5B17DRAFT_387240 [Nemania serpens]|nr:hypothetical protein F5B17DRAFT_387240 [Nemania serpens]